MFDSRTTAASLHEFKLAQDDVHVWCVPVKQPAHFVERCYSLLSGDEKARAGRYCFEHLQQAFVVARGVLRLLLSHYVDLLPEQLEFKYLHAGKPRLSEIHNRTVNFNLSHSQDLALYVFSKGHTVGVDLEYIRPLQDLDRIAESNFSCHEVAELKTLPPDLVLAGFFNCWTRKEAYIKAIGDGFSFPLQEFDVSLKPGEPAMLLSVHRSVHEAARWSMLDLYPAAGYAAALVTDGNVRSVVYHEWSRFEHFINS